MQNIIIVSYYFIANLLFKFAFDIIAFFKLVSKRCLLFQKLSFDKKIAKDAWMSKDLKTVL